ncbi:hypothetical protein niasHT_006346 [Heterodera trifolii]|uniref:BTB/POZ domain-containing protein n=1 Tax=Heterodera trifolii TaxID=157864 RepID=A0ABD2M4T2_9BILA
MPSSVERMKHLLSTGENSDVHFLVGDEDAKEILPSHQLILKNASNVFEAMFRPDAKKEQGENASAGCPLVKVADVEAAAFKVMLSFIYADDLDELDGNNAMAVLYAAKKYNIPDLVDASLQIPISELRNVFFAFAQTRLFKLEDFSIKCLRYICQNAAKLFESNDFLQIDQEMLCVLLDSDLLLFSDEFEIWKTTLRWADEKCRQIGIEYSSKNRRSILGPALFKIRFPNIHEEDFAKCVVPSDVLTVEEVLGVYQFNAHPCSDFAIKCLLYICQNAVQLFGSKDILQIDQKMLCVLLDCDRLLLSDEFEIWKIALRWADEKCCQNGIECSSKNRRSVLGPAVFKIRFPNIHEEDFAKCVVPSGVLTMEELLGIYQFNAHPFLYLRGVPGLYSLKFPSHGRIFNWNKARANRRVPLADAVEINGLAWKIEAEIRKIDGTDEKYLGFYLRCDAKEEGPWKSVLSATFRIVSEKSEAENSIGTRCDHVFDNKSYGWGFNNFITFAELMEFYDREEDKVTLTIDVTVKDEKKELVSDPDKSNGTLSMEIEKVSKFAREIIWSERKSETVHIKGFPWKIWAQIQTKNESTDNEKWLGIYLECDAPKECTKIGVANELMDPCKGLYEKKEDKVTLAIDVTLKEAKMADNS